MKHIKLIGVLAVLLTVGWFIKPILELGCRWILHNYFQGDD